MIIVLFFFTVVFTNRTIIAQPLSSSLTSLKKKKILHKKKDTVNIVSAKINKYLNPSKYNFYDPSKEDFIEPKSIKEILIDLVLSEDTKYSALQLSEDSDLQIHLRRPPNSCFIKNYFRADLKAWYANMDIQPVLNEHKAISYMCLYLRKTEDNCLIQ